MDAEWRRNLESFAREEKKDLGLIIRQQGRLLGVRLAHLTKPTGLDKATQQKLLRRIESDIKRGAIGLKFLAESMERAGTEWTMAVASMARAGQIEALQYMLAESSWAVVPINDQIDPATSRATRDPRTGRPPKNLHVSRKQIVTNAASITAYAKQEGRKAGMAKGGWAGASAALGGTRGIPAWVNKHKQWGTAVDRTSLQDNPYVILRNNIKYIKALCGESEIRSAQNAQRKAFESYAKGVQRRKRKRL